MQIDADNWTDSNEGGKSLLPPFITSTINLVERMLSIRLKWRFSIVKCITFSVSLLRRWRG